MHYSTVSTDVKTTSKARAIAATRSLTPAVLAVAGVFAALLLTPFLTHAQASPNFEVTGWIPYWRQATGTADTMPHLDKLTEVNPFVYTLKQDGTLADNGSLDQEPWLSFNAAAKARGVRVVPTVMSGDRALMHRILSNESSRRTLVDEIVRTVNQKGYDGIDIDFEGKSADTRDYFSAFLRELQAGLGNKWLMCTIETRIPLADQYWGVTMPAGAGQYSNDLKAINQYCDRVRIMAYDQQRIDRKVNAEWEARGELYAPVGDPAWIEKVVNHMTQDIAREKLLIGVPTYGYEYAVTAYSGNEYVYDILWTFNPGYAVPLAQERGITPTRAQWGELHFTYISNLPTSTPPTNLGANSALLASAAASSFATQNNSNMTFRYMVWPDEQSVQTKIDLAKRLGVRGISIFKFDGGQDPDIWNTLSGVRGAIETKTASAVPTTPSTPGGNATIAQLLAQVQALQAQLAALQGQSGTAPAAPARAAITRSLRVGSVGEDVRTLQMVLNSDSATRIAVSGAGSPGNETTRFGSLTLAALKKFQVKYGIAKSGQAGYGVFGPKTRAQVNALIASR